MKSDAPGSFRFLSVAHVSFGIVSHSVEAQVKDRALPSGPNMTSETNHLVVLFHGLWGNPSHLKQVQDTLLKQHPDLHVLVPKSNSDNSTYDGIEVGGERITHEIEEKIKELEAAGTKITRISIAGYSLGGLVARYTVGLLYKAGVFDHAKPTNFTTFATPHLGVRTPNSGYRSQIWNVLGSRTLSTSGQQMFLVDKFRDTGGPLLSLLADPNSIFVKGLAMFERKSVYANTLNDRSVPYYTSALSRIDPFVDPDAVDVNYLDGQEEDVILDPSDPVSPRKPTETALAFHEQYFMSQRTRESIPFYAVLFSVLPLAVPVFLVNAGVQTYRSAARVRLHESSKLIDLKRYRMSLLEDGQAAQDRMVERLASPPVQQQVYLPTPPPEPSTRNTSPASSVTKVAASGNEKNDSPWPTLALADEQFEMIDNLDKCVGFIKYPVHIQKVRHTHAAIVVRIDKESFKEGRAVLGHWAKEFIV